MYYIYKMIHRPSGRVYIGQHRLSKGKTPENDGYYGSGTLWRRIFKKHKDECVKVVIDYADDQKATDELEKKYIAHYRSVYGQFCVNITEGGQGGTTFGFKGHRHTEDVKRTISAKKKGIKSTLSHEKCRARTLKAWETRRKMQHG